MEGTAGQKIKAASHLVRGHLGVNRVASKDQANLLISSLPPDQRLSARSAGSQHASSASLAASAATRPYQRGRTNSPGLTYPRALTCVQHTNHATRATSIVVYLPDSTLRCSCHSALPVTPCPLLQLGDPRAWGPGTRHRRPRRRLPCSPCSLILIF